MYEVEYTTTLKRIGFDRFIVPNDFEILNYAYEVDIKRTKALRLALASDKERGEEYLADLHNFLLIKADEEVEQLRESVKQKPSENE